MPGRGLEVKLLEGLGTRVGRLWWVFVGKEWNRGKGYIGVLLS